MCEALDINESGYYQHLQRESQVSKRDLLSVRIDEVLEEDDHNSNYGARRMQIALDLRDWHYSLWLVHDVMDTKGLLHKVRRPCGCTKVSKEQKELENLIKGDFTAPRPFMKALTDITVIDTAEGKLYVAVIIDCFDGFPLAIAISTNMKTDLCIKAVENMYRRYGDRIKGMILHSDRGAQYTSAKYRDYLKSLGILQSFTDGYHCFSNARMESFWSVLKKEEIYQNPTYAMTRDAVKSMVFRYVCGYYTWKRVNTYNPKGLPPGVYRMMYENGQMGEFESSEKPKEKEIEEENPVKELAPV